MENVLATHEEPYNPACPVVAMDEQPFQLTKEIRRPIPAAWGKAKRKDRLGQGTGQEYGGMGNPEELGSKGCPLAFQHRKSQGETTDTLPKN